MKKVEQLNGVGIVVDFDIKKSRKQILNTFSKFGEVENASGFLNLSVDGNIFHVLVKNVTYLGHPHPIHKKRIQIPKEWGPYLKLSNTVLCGVYSGIVEDMFVVFANVNFYSHKLNQSSAHVSTNDILQAKLHGAFSKLDKNGNLVQVFTEQFFMTYLKDCSEALSSFNSIQDLFIWQQNYGHNVKSPLLKYCSDFANRVLGQTWYGVLAYNEMVNVRYKNAYQAEWAGFFHEFKFEKYILDRKIDDYISMHGDWVSRFDLDLRLNDCDGTFFGDIKTHSNGVDLLGNDFDFLDKALTESGRIWLLIANHITVKDKEYGGVVLKHWNALKMVAKKGNPSSLYSKMKYSVSINEYLVLEINNYNKKYLSEFNQGKQQSGKTRKVKFKISNRDIDNFVVLRLN